MRFFFLRATLISTSLVVRLLGIFIQANNPKLNKDLEENTFGELLSMFRGEASKTQLEISLTISNLGYPVDTTTISRYESGSRRPEAEFIPYYARALRLREEEEELLLNAYITQDRVNALESYLRGKENVRRSNK